MSDPRSRIPSIDGLLATPEAGGLVERFGRERVVDALRGAVNQMRTSIGAGDARVVAAVEDPAWYVARVGVALEADDVPSLRRVINATGVVLHTNLGRAPLAEEALIAMRTAATYSNLEFDLTSGVRGSRYDHCRDLLCELTGSEDALVVNNAAGALVLAMSTVALGRGVAVSRGELVEIGGGFRIPEVVERSGARLVEVGSTNRTRPSDYREMVSDGTASAVLKVHRSNFRMTGFTEEAAVEDLVGIGAEFGVPVVHDLGSGLMVPAEVLGLPNEPRAEQSVAAGADAVVISGDKLLGGPQAGIIVGRADLVAQMRRNPLCRALRVDKVTLAGLEATLRLYRDPSSVVERIPTLRMLSADTDELRSQAEEMAAELLTHGVQTTLVATRGAVGGGTYPGTEFDSWALELTGVASADELARALRDGTPPVVGRIVDRGLRLDMRTVLPGERGLLSQRVVEAVADATGGPGPD